MQQNETLRRVIRSSSNLLGKRTWTATMPKNKQVPDIAEWNAVILNDFHVSQLQSTTEFKTILARRFVTPTVANNKEELIRLLLLYKLEQIDYGVMAFCFRVGLFICSLFGIDTTALQDHYMGCLWRCNRIPNIDYICCALPCIFAIVATIVSYVLYLSLFHYCTTLTLACPARLDSNTCIGHILTPTCGNGGFLPTELLLGQDAGWNTSWFDLHSNGSFILTVATNVEAVLQVTYECPLGFVSLMWRCSISINGNAAVESQRPPLPTPWLLPAVYAHPLEKKFRPPKSYEEQQNELFYLAVALSIIVGTATLCCVLLCCGPLVCATTLFCYVFIGGLAFGVAIYKTYIT